ncbi:MAG: chloramphenicol acetyltransferase [Acidobacteria bacterium]|nr:MAG: chloramphenicol acetyltransferase [Acidobacteriota bacterium]
MGAWVDLKSWKRREHYQLFRRYQQPFFSVTVDADVTAVWNGCRKPGAASFFLTSLFLMLKAVNDVEAFRLRVRPRGVWRHDRVGVGPTIRRPDETFGFTRLEPADRLDDFVELSSAAIARAMNGSVLKTSKPADDVVYHSVLPWLRFTGYSNALPGHDSIPRIVFGRAVPDGRRVKMPVAVEVHHAVVDGADVGRFFQRFGEELERGSVSPERRIKASDR